MSNLDTQEPNTTIAARRKPRPSAATAGGVSEPFPDYGSTSPSTTQNKPASAVSPWRFSTTEFHAHDFSAWQTKEVHTLKLSEVFASESIFMPILKVSEIEANRLSRLVLSSDVASASSLTPALETFDELRTPEGEIRQIIHSLRTNSLMSHNQSLADRLEFLLQAMDEEGEQWTGDSPESLRQMLLFLNTHPEFHHPTVTVTPAGTFRAQWTYSSGEHFAVDFHTDGQVFFVVFCLNPIHPNSMERISGYTHWDSLMENIGPRKVERWVKNAG